MEVMLLSFLQVLVREEWKLSSAEEASIAAAVFFGELPGSVFWGFLGDKIGRRKGFAVSAFLVGTVGVLSAFAGNIVALSLLRGIVGFGVSGSLLPYDLLSEFLPPIARGKFLLGLQLFWTLGTLLVCAGSWLLVKPFGWQGLTIFVATPLFVALCCYRALVRLLVEDPLVFFLKCILIFFVVIPVAGISRVAP